MRFFLFILILILLISQSLNGQTKTENSSVEVVSSKWTKSRQKIEKQDDQTAVRVQTLSGRTNRNFERTRRVNDPVGTPDPNADTIDGRSATLEKNVQEARSRKTVTVDGFLYQVKLRNASTKTIEILFWEYQFKERANPANTMTRQYLCGVNIKPEKEKELRIFSTSSPGNLVSAESTDSNSESLFDEKIIINRVEYADGTIWQRKDWSYSEMKPAITRALETPWGLEMCRNL